MPGPVELSLVVPVYNERDNLPLLVAEIGRALAGGARPYEVVTVDDGSTDDSLEVLKALKREHPELRRLRPNPETEQTAMRVAMEYERSQGRAVSDVHEKDLGYDLTSLDTRTGELRLIEVKGLAASEGDIILTPNEHRVAEDRRDCYWLYVVTSCGTEPPELTPVFDPANKPWEPITTVEHFRLSARKLLHGEEA